ncbi:MAG: hypothetical protein HKN09_00445, partial [Saprospiraceae bacterium]|nr:hypothetical protein [Saprospiraceae bacterium]
MVSRIGYIFSILLGMVQLGFGQLTVDPGNTLPVSSDNLIQNVFLGSGVEILDIKYFGDAQAVGLFDNAEPLIGINRGIIMTTGYATDATKTSDLIANEDTSLDTLEDEDLSGLLVNNIDLIDLAKYEISFIPSSDTLRFRYVFASEEYPDFVCSSTNDVFGFFIDGPNPNGGSYDFKNIALIPDPMDPDMTSFLDFPVSVNFVNSGEPGSFNTASPYCEDPLGSLNYSMYYNAVPDNQQPIYNAYLDVFIAEAAVIPCQAYTIKIAIADGRLGDFDSAVFLEEKSFTTNGLVLDVNMPGLNGGLAEGCEDGFLRFSLPQAISEDKEINLRIIDSPSMANDAILNEDYILSTEAPVIRAGQKFVELHISALEDFISEEEEYIRLAIQLDPCSTDTIIFPVNDNSIIGLSLIDSLSSCADKAVQIPLDISVNDLGETRTFSNSNTYVHNTNDSIINAPIIVSGMAPGRLDKNIIAEICIENFTHLRLNDCDFYLEAPNGNILELSTDNGQRPDNDLQEDRFIETCFTIFSGTNINLGNPLEGQMDLSNPSYTGSYLPEGNMENWLFPLTSPINGEYRLIIVDDEKDSNYGSLTGWNIKFRAAYERRIRWQADANFNCTDCPEPLVRPSESEYVYLDITDSYGCSYSDSVWIEAYPVPDTPELSCSDTLSSGLVFSWSDIADAVDYEIRINEQFPWFSVAGDNSFLKEGYAITTSSDNNLTIEGLLANEEISIIIKAISANGCESGRDTIFCTYDACNGVAPVIDSIIVDQPNCADELLVRVDVYAQSMALPLSYRIEYANLTIENNDGIFYQVPQGQWPLRIVDNNGCTILDTINVNQPSPILIAPDVDEIDCHGGLGAINVLVLGGTGNFTYLWSHGPTSASVDMLPAGLYELTVTDDLGCTIEYSYSLEEPDSLGYTYT